MNRVTVKLAPRIADRVRLAKVEISATVGQQLTTSQTVDYLIEHWRLTKGQRHILTVGAGGKIVSSPHATP